MPRIPAALAVLCTVACCIGFNAARYPVVWEMLKQSGQPLQPVKSASSAEPAIAKAVLKPSNSPPSTSKVVKKEAAAKKETKPPAPEGEYCTADGVCRINGAPEPPRKTDAAGERKGSPSTSPAAPAQEAPVEAKPGGKYASLPVMPPPEPAPVLPAAAPKPAPPPPPLSNKPAPLAGRLVPVPDAPPPNPKTVSALDPSRKSPSVTGPSDPAGPQVRPLPPADDFATAASPAGSEAVGDSVPFYPTTGYPVVDFTRLRAGQPGSLTPVAQ